MVRTQPDHWKLILDPKVSKIKSLDFFNIFLKHKVENESGQVQDSPVGTNMILNVCIISYESTHSQR